MKIQVVVGKTQQGQQIVANGEIALKASTVKEAFEILPNAIKEAGEAMKEAALKKMRGLVLPGTPQAQQALDAAKEALEQLQRE